MGAHAFAVAKAGQVYLKQAAKAATLANVRAFLNQGYHGLALQFIGDRLAARLTEAIPIFIFSAT